MYTGSNVLPIGIMLNYLHLKQSFRTSEEVRLIRVDRDIPIQHDDRHRNALFYSRMCPIW